MLKRFLATSPQVQRYGSRFHSRLAAQNIDQVAECLRRDDWQCHICSTRIPYCMEIDHTGRHVPCGPGGLKTICQFCHNLRHPVWSAGRGRLQMIWAPDISQASLMQLAWTTFLTATPKADPDLRETARKVIEAVARRESLLATFLGSSHPQGFFETLRFTNKRLQANAMEQLVSELDGFVRFWPRAANRIVGQPEHRCSDLCIWSQNSFLSVAETAISDFWDRCGGAEELPGRYESLRLGLAEGAP